MRIKAQLRAVAADPAMPTAQGDARGKSSLRRPPKPGSWIEEEEEDDPFIIHEQIGTQEL